MNSESYINQSISIRPQIGFVRGGVSSNFKSGWLHDVGLSTRSLEIGRKERVGRCCSGGAA